VIDFSIIFDEEGVASFILLLFTIINGNLIEFGWRTREHE
jgi:hypothetical protein